MLGQRKIIVHTYYWANVICQHCTNINRNIGLTLYLLGHVIYDFLLCILCQINKIPFLPSRDVHIVFIDISWCNHGT